MPNSLIIHWPYFLLALAMLWFPRQWMRLGPAIARKRRRPQTAVDKFSAAGPGADPENKHLNLAREFRGKRNYLDIFRAIVGGSALMLFSLDASGDNAPQQLFAIQAGVLFLAVMIQCIRFEGRLGFFAPVFFYTGLSIAVSGPIPALFAFVFMLALNPAVASPRVFISGFAVALLPLGYFLKTPTTYLLLNVGLLLLPPMVSLLSGRSMAIYAKKPKVA